MEFCLDDGEMNLTSRQGFDLATQVWVYESWGIWETMDIHPCVKGVFNPWIYVAFKDCMGHEVPCEKLWISTLAKMWSIFDKMFLVMECISLPN